MQLSKNEMKLLARRHFCEKMLAYYESMLEKAEGELGSLPPKSEKAELTKAIVDVLREERQKSRDTLTYLTKLLGRA